MLSDDVFEQNIQELVVVDDFSEDNTSKILHSFSHPKLRLIHMSDQLDDKFQSSKKKALSAGVNHITSEYIIQLDADVIPHTGYLKTVIDYINTHDADFVAAAVVIREKTDTFTAFQVLDYAGMMAVTQAGIYSGLWWMANGANMIYKRSMIDFSSNDLASGDDIYGVQAVAAAGGRVDFLKSSQAIVYTEGMSDCSSFFNQRIRWLTKNKYMKSMSMILMMLVPFLSAVVFISYFILLGFKTQIVLILIMHHIFLVGGVNYIYLSEMATYFGLNESMKRFGTSQFMHITYVALIGSLSLFIKNYSWKGRKLS